MKKPSVLDSFALIAFLGKESGFEKVRDLLHKAQFPVSYADAFAVATAIREQARLVTGDPELRSVAHLVEMHWL